MADHHKGTSNPDQPIRYQIRLQGHLDQQSTAWDDGLAITREEKGTTLLSGSVVDQAALHGLLKKVRDLGMPLLLVARVASAQVDVPDGNAETGIASKQGTDFNK